MKPFIKWALLLALSWFALAAAESVSSVPRFIEAAPRIASERNLAAALALLDEISQLDDWSFGSGQGPWDRTYPNMLSLVCFREFLQWDRPAVRETIPAPTAGIQRWLTADPRSPDAMLELLRSPEAGIRWLACEKLKILGVVAPELLPQLRQMVQTDDYLLVLRQPVPVQPGERPLRPPMNEERIFAAPLRQAAIDLLNVAGQNIAPLDQRELSREGLQWLGRLYLKHRDDTLPRLGMVSALRWLSPRTPEIVEAQKHIPMTITRDEELFLFQALAKSTVSVEALMALFPAPPPSQKIGGAAGAGGSFPFPWSALFVTGATALVAFAILCLIGKK